MPTLTVTLTNETSNFISKEVEMGHYPDTNHAVEALLAKAAEQEREWHIKATLLEASLQKGLDSGLAEGDIEDVFRRVTEQTGFPKEVFAK